jgi:aerobic-type carbon monoxide dehydrogenase small subunit (CoxS/CutS family)
MAFTLKINGTPHKVDVDGDTPLLWVLRDVLGMTGTKFGCGQALCGARTVHVDGAATRSCITTVDSIGESAITTIEAIGQAPQGAALQKAWLELEVVQCGYCQSGRSCRRRGGSVAARGARADSSSIYDATRISAPVAGRLRMVTWQIGPSRKTHHP